MNIFNFFRKKTSNEIEDEFIDEIVSEEEDDAESDSFVSVIYYSPDPNDQNIPRLNILVDEFHNASIPEIGSIIWITESEGNLRPFKVIRYDYVQNGSDYDSLRTYIVVEVATYNDVLPNPRYSI